MSRHRNSESKREVIPYALHWIDEDDVAAVVDVLRSKWVTTGPKVDEFEAAFAKVAGTEQAVAVSSGTAALHAAAFALGIQPGDEVIVPAMTFAATANCVVYQGGAPVFVDVDPETLLIDPACVEKAISPRTKAIIAVDYAGQPCDYEAMRSVVGKRGIRLVADASHALGGSIEGRPVGSLAEFSTFSLHPAKHITTAEGGMITTDDAALAERMRIFRNHGITTDHRQRANSGSWFYEMVDLGYNYRLSDIHCALGISQLAKLANWVDRRRQIAVKYGRAFGGMTGIRPLAVRPGVVHAYHLYVVQIDEQQAGMTRAAAYSALREARIAANVHYVPAHLHPFYRRRFGTHPGMCPVAEAAYERILSLPMFPALSNRDMEYVVNTIAQLLCNS